MTSPLVNPAAGYITLSRLDSSTSRPSICTTNRCLAILVLLRAFIRRLIRAQPQKTREPQPAVRGPVAVAHLGDQLRAYPVGAPGVLAGHGAGQERRVGAGQWREDRQQLPLGRRADAATDPAP